MSPESPARVDWEVTRACEMACLHCRAASTRCRDTLELSLGQSRGVLEGLAGQGVRHIHFTGGDPLQRPDLEDLIAHARSLGLRSSVLPANTERLTPERLASLCEAGAFAVELRADGADAATHDRFRTVPGAFDIATRAARETRRLGMELWISSVLGPWNQGQLSGMLQGLRHIGAVRWHVGPSLPRGRAIQLTPSTPEENEENLTTLVDLAEGAPGITFEIREAPFVERLRSARRPPPPNVHAPRSGSGRCFIDHSGNICPDEFLSIPCGNVTRDSLAEVCQTHPFFRLVRDASRVTGKCARCPWLHACGGGSRARAYIITGDFTAPDPACGFEPA